MDLNSTETKFQPGVEESSFPNTDGLSDKRINEAQALWPIPLSLYPQLCTVRDHAHSYVNIRHSDSTSYLHP